MSSLQTLAREGRHPLRILIVLLGHISPDLQHRHGDYPAMYHGLMREPIAEASTTLHCDVWPLIDDPSLPGPELNAYDGVIFSGGVSMVSDNGPWLKPAVAAMQELLRRKIPVLGICLGHQVLAHSVGATVGRMHSGFQLGTRQLSRLDACDDEPLFDRLPQDFPVNVSHAEGVLKTSSAIKVLASSEQDPCHAMRVGECAWGVQFHPEFSREWLEDRLDKQRELDASSYGRWEGERRSLQETPVAVQVFQRFIGFCVKHRRQAADAVPAAR